MTNNKNGKKETFTLRPIEEQKTKVLVAGATGMLGSEICRLLAEQGKTIRALVRETSDAAKVNWLDELGAEIIRGDLKDRASLDAACAGIQIAISTVSSTLSRQEGDSIESVDHQGQMNLIEAAGAAGVYHFILISFPEMGETSPLEDAKRAAEDALRNSPMSYTILQPTFFTEVWLSPPLGFDAAGARARIYGTGDNKISWISYRDVAKFAAAAVENPKMFNMVLELGGPEALSPLEVVSIFEKVTGKSFELEHVPEDALRAQRADASDPLQKTFATLMLGYCAGQEIDMQRTLKTIPVELRSVEEYARSFIKSEHQVG